MENCWAEKYCKRYNKPGCNQFCEGYVVLEILYKFSNIPKKYQYPAILTTTGPDEKVYKEIAQIISGDIISWVNSGNSLLLWGERKGNGKTTMACAIANKFIREMASRTTLEPVVHFIKTAKFFEEMRQQFNNPTPEWPERLKMIETVPLLIIDDIGAERPSDWVRERLLTIIDERYSNNLSTIYTSNCNKQQMMENLHERVYDRIKDARALEFKGPSWRGLSNV
jgi:DNA replication protein DnaC